MRSALAALLLASVALSKDPSQFDSNHEVFDRTSVEAVPDVIEDEPSPYEVVQAQMRSLASGSNAAEKPFYRGSVEAGATGYAIPYEPESYEEEPAVIAYNSVEDDSKFERLTYYGAAGKLENGFEDEPGLPSRSAVEYIPDRPALYVRNYNQGECENTYIML